MIDAPDNILAHFYERLRELRLIEISKIPEGHAARVCEHVLGKGLEQLGIDVTFVDTYSAEKRCEFVEFMDKKFVVIDHSLSEHFGVLNYIFATEVPDTTFAIGLFQRALAEACRASGFRRRREYAFFIRRALETKPFLRLIQSGRHGLDIYWQDLFIISHEIAHGLKPGSELAKTLDWSSILSTSKAVTDSAIAINAALFETLDGKISQSSKKNVFGNNFPSIDLDILADVLLKNGVDKNKIESALRNHAGSQRFLREVSCDSFGLTLIKLVIADSEQRMSENDYREFVEDILFAIYRTFLNMRFTGYVAQAVCVHFEDDERPISPIDLDILIEFSLRGRLAVYGIVDVWLETTGCSEGGAEMAVFLRKITEISTRHTDRLFFPMNALLEQTIYDSSFISSLPSLLEEDGYDSPDFEDDPFKALRFADAFWHIVAS